MTPLSPVSRLASLESVLQSHPHITYANPTSPNYASLRATYILDNPAVPLAIVRPQTATDVVTIVQWAVSISVPFVVRSGGNNLFGQSHVHGALTIDMRDIAYVEVDETRSSARVGGGVLNGAIATTLHKEGLATAVGAIPFVGYVGWATYGGYGLFTQKYGLGVDQILAAKVVNAEGNLMDADAEMLKGIRGAGGIVGIIVELTIKVYPLKSILAGVIIFDSKTLSTTVQEFAAGYEALQIGGLPSELGIQPAVMNGPGGKALAVLFLWSSEGEATGRTYQAKIASLGTVVMDTVAVTTIPDWQQGASQAVAPSGYGAISTFSIRKLTPEVAAIIGKHTEKMPSEPFTAFTMHELRNKAEIPAHESVFATREPHLVLEFIETASTESNVKASKDWASNFHAELQQTDAENIIKSTYVSLTPPGSVPLSEIYGSHYETLKELKGLYDPKNVFSNAIPKIPMQE